MAEGVRRYAGGIAVGRHGQVGNLLSVYVAGGRYYEGAAKPPSDER